jgi:DNA-binding response OmpR family regulator
MKTNPTSPATPKPAVMIAGRNKILIVEDDRKIALALSTRLQAAGQDVLLAYDTLTGMESAVKNRPDLILLDIYFPDGIGFVVAEKIRNLVPKFIPIIFITASQKPGLREQAKALGAAGFLEKPFEADELMTTIQNALKPPGAPSGA